jgi:lipopolysaccharide export system permease protein
MPISFLISLIITLAKLSSEYELIVITSFGLNPKTLLKQFLPITLLLSLVLLIISLALVPKATYLSNKLIFQKQKEANFNIKASEFGQKFGDWLIYIDSKEDKVYNEVKLFKADASKDQFILSKNAVLKNHNGELSFELNDGKSFVIKKDEINQINYSRMDINDSLSSKELPTFINAYFYWKELLEKDRQIDKFVFSILVSIFPFISLFLVIAFGYYNPRYEKNRAVMYSFAFTVLYYVAADLLIKNIEYYALIVIPVLWPLITYYFYTKRVKKVY